MPVKVRIPTPLRKLTNNEEVIEVSASTVGGAFVEMQRAIRESRSVSG